MNLHILLMSEDHKVILELCVVVDVQAKVITLKVQGENFSCFISNNKNYLKAFCLGLNNRKND